MARPLVVLAIGVAFSMSGTPRPARADVLTLEQAVSRAVSHNPDVRAADADVLAARARFTGASIRSPYNPELGVVSGTRSGEGVPVVVSGKARWCSQWVPFSLEKDSDEVRSMVYFSRSL